MNQNQISTATKYNRYPEIFSELTKIIKNPDKILSIGCSTGVECNTLSNLYYTKSKIIGLDINTKVISNNKKNNKNKNITYYDNLSDLNKYNKFNLIFAMSVLCRWPESKVEYTFQTFTETLDLIDNLLEKNGYLCIYNSKYLFTDTELFKEKYKIVTTSHKETGFVYKYTLDNKITTNYPYFLFQKIVDQSVELITTKVEAECEGEGKGEGKGEGDL
jgi:chemotaxis methyl-accepting protein methylase